MKRTLNISIFLCLLILCFASCGNKSDGGKQHTHNFGSWETVSAVTCETDGLDARYCVCGEKQTRTITKSGHNTTETITKEATSYASGEKTEKCSNCNYAKVTSYSLSEYTSEEIYEIAEKSVGEIATYTKNGSALALGTAFVISEDGKLVTNYHVIENAYSAKVTINGHEYNIANVLAYDKDIDLAILKINASSLKALPTQSIGIKGGATVYAVGSSEGYTLSFSTGVIASPNRTINGVSYLQHEAAISHGNSGGPLFNTYGEVIGINTLSYIEGQNLNFAISCSELDNLIYGTPLTMSAFYDKECNSFIRLKNYIIENGTYDSEDKEYILQTGSSYSSDYSSQYRRVAYYSIEDNKIYLSLFIDTSYLVSIYINEDLDGEYYWIYVDSSDYYMSGTIFADTYNKNSLLGIANHNISYSALLTSARKLASSMVSLICIYIDSDLSEIGVTAYSLGFVCY